MPYPPDPLLGAGDSLMNKADVVPALMELTVWETINRSTYKSIELVIDRGECPGRNERVPGGLVL